MKLLEILEKQNANPTLLSSGQIRVMCPFRDLHTGGDGLESMFLTPDINAYHCFSCRSKGRLTVLLTSKYEIPLFEAMEMVHIDEYKKEKKQSLEDDDYYWDLKLPDVFEARGFTKELLVNKFKVGTKFITNKDGVRQKVTVIPNYWDGELRGIAYRIDVQRRDGTYKRISSWNSDGFNKEEYLYNGDARYKDYVIIVEGQSDVWRLFSYGYNVYGVLGSSLSDWQAEQIRKVKKVYIAGDCDLPGIRASESWYKKLYLHTDVEFINYPASDPCACKARPFKKAFENPCNYAEFKELTS